MFCRDLVANATADTPGYGTCPLCLGCSTACDVISTSRITIRINVTKLREMCILDISIKGKIKFSLNMRFFNRSSMNITGASEDI